MIRALFDTNVILDIALTRKPFYSDARSLFSLIDEKTISAGITATTITDLYYVVKKERGHEIAIDFVKSIVEVFDILGVDRLVVKNALDSNISDFEDAIQCSAAEVNQIDVILTRNKKDFQGSTVKVNTPKEFLAAL